MHSSQPVLAYDEQVGNSPPSLYAWHGTEAEYMACSAACQEVKWLLNFGALPHVSLTQPMTLWCDNQGAVLLSLNGIQHQSTKHIDLRHHFIRDMVKGDLVSIKHIGSNDQVADIMTKYLTPEKFKTFRRKLGLTREVLEVISAN